jgi:UDP-N-acetylmuramoyl-L-alanyl-D-glutamate--2,6-diaminopimelate ligase
VKLSTLLAAVAETGDTGLNGAVRQDGSEGLDPDIGSLHYRSREVLPGGLFVAIPGHSVDGHDFIEDALVRGAAAVIVQRDVSHDGVFVKVPDSRSALAQLAAAFYGFPSEAVSLVGITGTNGKTTVTYLVESMLSAAGFSSGIIGTVNCRFAGQTLDSPVTTPESRFF